MMNWEIYVLIFYSDFIYKALSFYVYPIGPELFQYAKLFQTQYYPILSDITSISPLSPIDVFLCQRLNTNNFIWQSEFAPRVGIVNVFFPPLGSKDESNYRLLWAEFGIRRSHSWEVLARVNILNMFWWKIWTRQGEFQQLYFCTTRTLFTDWIQFY